MKFKTISIIGRKVAKVASKAKFHTVKVLPDGLVIFGIGGFAVTCVLVAKGTKKHEEIKDENDSKIKKTEKAIVCYGPAGIAGCFTIGCFTGGHYILRKRNIALVAAYKAVDDSFKKYRSAVIEKYGEDEDYRLKNGLRVEKESVSEIGADGKKRKIKKEVEYLDGEVDGYSFIFDNAHSMMSVDDPVTVRDRLEMARKTAEATLIGRGYITLNEVLRSIGLHETTAGQIVGWQMKGNGDGFIDFGIRQVRTLMDEGGLAYILDFNVDGPIYQDIDKYTRLWEE